MSLDSATTIQSSSWPAGGREAARLGQAGLRVLLLERAKLPSPPAASSPATSTRRLCTCSTKSAPTSGPTRAIPPHRPINLRRARRPSAVAVRARQLWVRDYMYAIDRERFDAELWRAAAASPNVDARDGLTVSDLLRHGERVAGAPARAPGGAEQRFSADWVVGADGRFSVVARKAGARTLDERADLPTTIYYAYWQGAELHDDGGPTIVSYGTGRGFGYGLMDSADGRTCVVIEGRRARSSWANQVSPSDGKACCASTRGSGGGLRTLGPPLRRAVWPTSAICTARPAGQAGTGEAMPCTRRTRSTARASTTRRSPLSCWPRL